MHGSDFVLQRVDIPVSSNRRGNTTGSKQLQTTQYKWCDRWLCWLFGWYAITNSNSFDTRNRKFLRSLQCLWSKHSSGVWQPLSFHLCICCSSRWNKRHSSFPEDQSTQLCWEASLGKVHNWWQCLHLHWTCTSSISWWTKEGAKKDAYNFYLGQLRIQIKMTFGRLVNKWRIFKRPLQVKLKDVDFRTSCEQVEDF